LFQTIYHALLHLGQHSKEVPTHPTAASNLQTKNHAIQPVFMAPVLPILYPDVAFSFIAIVQKKSTNTLANIPRRY
jgi:hypothetical protein